MALEKQVRAELNAFRKSSVDLAEELTAIVKAVKYLRAGIENDMVSEDADRKSLVKAVADLTIAYSKAVDAKVKLEKHLKQEAEDLTEEQQIEAIVGFVKELTPKKRRLVVQELLDYHRMSSPSDTL